MKHKGLLMWCILLLVTSAEAKVIEELNITDTFLSSFKIRENVIMTISNNTHDSVSFGVPEDAFDAEANGKDAEIKDNSVEVNLGCSYCVVSLEYSVPSVLEEKEDMFGFFKNFLEYDVHKLNYRLVLPKGYGPGYITPGSEPAVPPPMKTGKDGSRTYMEWYEVDPELPKVYYIRMKAEEQERSKTLIVFVILAVIVLIFWGGKKLLKNSVDNEQEKKE